MRLFNKACNWVSVWCFQNRIFPQFKVHHGIYYELRDQFPDLTSQMCIRVIARVAATYLIDKSIQHHFKRNSAIPQDKHTLLYKKDLSSVSISTIKGREKYISISFQQKNNITIDTLRNGAELVYRSGEFYLQAFIEQEPKSQQSFTQFIGVDMGIVNLATTSQGTNYTGAVVEKVRIKYQKQRKSLQKVGTKSAKRKLKRLSGKERRFKRNTNHIISKQIVQAAEKALQGIAVEDLTNWKKTVSKSQRDKFGKWAWSELTTFIQYKAELAGIPFLKVDPRNTSRHCRMCGLTDKRSRNDQAHFQCIRCGHTENADLQAAKNISMRAENDYKVIQITIWLLDITLSHRAAINQPNSRLQKKQLPSKGRATS